MAKMTDVQRAVLEAAVKRIDGAALAPEGMGKSARSKVGASLIARKLMREIRQKGDLSVWRVNEDGRNVSLVLTRAGRNAISAGDRPRVADAVAGSKPESKNNLASKMKSHVECASLVDRGLKVGADATMTDPALRVRPVEQAAAANAQPRAGSKQALLVEMISRPQGATIDALIDATGWLRHTTRAALTGLRKRGFAIQRVAQQDAPSLYMIGAVGADTRSTAADSRA